MSKKMQALFLVFSLGTASNSIASGEVRLVDQEVQCSSSSRRAVDPDLGTFYVSETRVYEVDLTAANTSQCTGAVEGECLFTVPEGILEIERQGFRPSFWNTMATSNRMNGQEVLVVPSARFQGNDFSPNMSMHFKVSDGNSGSEQNWTKNLEGNSFRVQLHFLRSSHAATCPQAVK
jgi:hypothetical protein